MTDTTAEGLVPETEESKRATVAIREENDSITTQLIVGHVLFWAGAAVVLYAMFLMPTTVETTTSYLGIDVPDRVANLDAIAQKFARLFGGAVAAIVGAMFISASNVRQTTMKARK